ncbi:amino acid permease [Hespellia stercorisuis]|uniref:Amino acid/polyamine/organocation transporter, APC superfamily (TC 2.A.3) n=1 Tax=Hespellia stercorisuis DSM 15480 TaxID=1121950 RepID=A0A1M6V6N1_9FIRM|nr:amino acid permease [Hespellia stercorisuis]SHK77041.1 amino acid/polyamine/organocation transporter, APC superfamily (TC 2.A.3) [Hespellia stercorisuis DSM 15480]
MKDGNSGEKKMLWYSLALMAFTAVWGFGNVVNGFSEYNGLKAIVAWVLVFALYFVPYALMVGELGSAFKTAGGGVSSWIHETIGPRLAFYAGWTYWIVHMPYISQKPSGSLIALSWAIFRDNRISSMNITLLQFVCLGVFLLALWLASKGLGVLKTISSIAGSCSFIMSILFIIMMIAAPAITGNAGLLDIDWSLKTFMPTFDMKFFLNLSILVFAVGGCEKISPYVNKTKDPAKDFPKGMIALAIMVCVCAVLGTIAMGMMFDSNHIPDDLMTNGAYYCFQKLGEYYGVGGIFVVLYGLTNLACQFSVLILSIDAPLRILLESADEDYIPKVLFKQNKHGAYTNGFKLIFVIVTILIVVPAFGIQSVDALVKWLVKLNSVCMPLRYLWVFAAYIALKKAGDKFPAEYRFVKSKTVGMIFGGWCFFFTAFACILGIYSEDKFQLVMNIVTPFVMIALGLIMPYIARRQKAK